MAATAAAAESCKADTPLLAGASAGAAEGSTPKMLVVGPATGPSTTGAGGDETSVSGDAAGAEETGEETGDVEEDAFGAEAVGEVAEDLGAAATGAVADDLGAAVVADDLGAAAGEVEGVVFALFGDGETVGALVGP